MKKVILLILVSILLLVAFTSCAKIKLFGGKACEHEWTEATCQSAKTCKLCGTTEGSTAPHKTAKATCTDPQRCTVCGFTSDFWQGALGHDWIEANCLTQTAKHCDRCGLVEGEPAQHVWSEPTCFANARCSVCLLEDKGTQLEHNFQPTAPVEPTCTTPGKTVGSQCTLCGEYESKEHEPKDIPALEHKGYEVEIPGTDATCDTNGLTDGKRCEKCGMVTEHQLVIEAKGHQRYVYGEDGQVLVDGYVKTEYPVNPNTGLPYAKCETDGVTTYECQVCHEHVETVEPKVHHNYNNATCTDENAQCIYCGKDIEHEFADPTCTSAAMCIICYEVDNSRPAYNHNHPDTGESAMSAASCLAPSTCALCGHVEGEKLTHQLVATAVIGKLTYRCTGCDVSFSPATESYYYDGSTHDYMVPVNNIVGGYETYTDDLGNLKDLPAIKVDQDGNKYYSLIKVKEPEKKDKESEERHPPQLQIWMPMQRAGFEGFSAKKSAVGFMSFRINALMDKNFSMTLVEGGSWGTEDVIKDIFVLTAPTAVNFVDEETGSTYTKTVVRFEAMDDDGNSETPRPVLFEKDITQATSLEDKFTGWVDVCIGIVLDDSNDTINLHYYINGNYICTVTRPLLTSGDGIKCVYLSGNTDAIGSGLMFDDFGFGYTEVGNWPFDVNHEHKFTVVSQEVEATCTTDGYQLMSCACGVVGYRISIPAEGHQLESGDEVLADCVNDGHSAYSICTREGCGHVIVPKVIYTAFGHDYDTKTDRAPTCTRPGVLYQICLTCGHVNQENRPQLQHEYPITSDCGLGAVCTLCGYQNNLPIGHLFSDATCTEPQVCQREGCGAIGEPALGHNMSDPTCTKASTCSRCGFVEGTMLSHNLEHTYVKSNLVYACTTCDAEFTVKRSTLYYLDGTTHSNMVGVGGNKNNFTTESGTELPMFVNDYYQYLNTTGNSGQLQLWVPLNDNKSQFGFSSDNYAVGFLSFRMNAAIDGMRPDGKDENSISIKLVDGISNVDGNGVNDRWTSRGVLGDLIVHAVKDGYITLAYKHSTDSGEIEICKFAVDSRNFTGWFDLKLGMEFNPETDQVTYHFYINGEYVTSFSRTITTKTNSINCVYISGYTTSRGSGILLDDIAFGYTANGEWLFDECAHEGDVTVVPPTCTTYGYTQLVCNKCGCVDIYDKVPAFGHTEQKAPDCEHGSLCATCGEYYGDALGHFGGTATCKEQATCERCGKKYGDTAHKIVPASCASASYCEICKEVFGTAVSHCPEATLDPDTETLVYSCKYCDATYKLNKFYYQDGSTSIGSAVPNAEDTSYSFSADDGNYKFVLEKAASSNGKAWVWLPSNTSGAAGDFSFKAGSVGVLSFSLDVYTGKSFQIHLIDSEYRGGGPAGDFWSKYTMQAIFRVSTPSSNNVVDIMGWDNEKLCSVTVTDKNKYTGMFDVTIGIELGTTDITFHYYINGEYVTSVTDTFTIASGKIDGVSFLCESLTVGSGYTLDNVVFGYAAPTAENPKPSKPKS